MINIKVYKNGYEIIGHSFDNICAQVTLWHWLTSNIIRGLDKEAKEYSSSRDNKDNPGEGYSWTIFNPETNNLKWIVEEFIVSFYEWSMKEYSGEVIFEQCNDDLHK